MELQVVDKNNKNVAKVALTEAYGEGVNKAVLYYALKASRNNDRHGTAAVKDRSQVSLTNKKAVRQKGTGGARHGARGANIFVGGGSAHGPRPRSYYEKLNKKFKAKSYVEALKALISANALKLVDAIEFDKPSSKVGREWLNKLGASAKIAVFVAGSAKNAKLSLRNLSNVTVVDETNLNVYDLLASDTVVMTGSFFEQINKRYAV